MSRALAPAAVVLVLLTCAPQPSSAACDSDADCSGGQVCRDRVCVSCAASVETACGDGADDEHEVVEEAEFEVVDEEAKA